MNKKTTDIVAYLSFIGWLIAYLAGTKEESKFHLNQGLVFAIAEIIVSILSNWLYGFLYFVVSLVGLALFVLWLIAFIGACKGEEKPAPILGTIKLL